MFAGLTTVHSRSSSGAVPPVDPFAGGSLAPVALAPAILAPPAAAAAPPVVPRPAAPAAGAMAGGVAAPAPKAPMPLDAILGLYDQPHSSSMGSLAAPPMAGRPGGALPGMHPSASAPLMPTHPVVGLHPAQQHRPAPLPQAHLSAQQQYALGAAPSQELFSDFASAKPAAQVPMAAAAGQPAAAQWTPQW